MSASAVRYPIMGELIEAATGLVRFTNLPELHEFLMQHKFDLVHKKTSNHGTMLFYKNADDCYIRIKTHGNKPGSQYRAGQAHLVVTDAEGLGKEDEWGSATSTGLVWGEPNMPKRMPELPITVPVDPQMQSAWALMTHFNFKVQTLEGAEKLLVR